jgi:hypothetical protein
MAHLGFTARFGILLAGLVLAFGAVAPGSALAKAGGSDLPFKGSVTGTSVHNLVTGQLDAVSAGKLTHLGRATLEQQALILIIGTPPNHTLDVSGTWTLTAANGDKLSGTSAGIGTPTDATHITLVIEYTATGGTGRFANASAEFTATFYHHQYLLELPVSYGEHVAMLDGHLSW